MISQEIGQDILEVHAAHGLWDSLEYLELFLSGLLHLHDGCPVVASVAIVGRAPHRHQVLVLNYANCTLNQWM